MGTSSPEACTRKSCPQLTEPVNGRVEGTFQFGSQANYSCNEGYYLLGNPVLYCELSGNDVAWSGNPHSVKVKILCQPPPQIPNGEFTNSHRDTFEYNEVVTYSCKPSGLPDEYSLVGESRLVCSGPNKWSSDPPVCKVVKCEYPHQSLMETLCQDLEKNFTTKQRLNMNATRVIPLKAAAKLSVKLIAPGYPRSLAVLKLKLFSFPVVTTPPPSTTPPILSPSVSTPPSTKPPISSVTGVEPSPPTKPPVSSIPGRPPTDETPSKTLGAGVIVAIVLAVGDRPPMLWVLRTHCEEQRRVGAKPQTSGCQPWLRIGITWGGNCCQDSLPESPSEPSIQCAFPLTPLQPTRWYILAKRDSQPTKRFQVHGLENEIRDVPQSSNLLILTSST
ncbi:hypothetical protein QTO34_011531 [Cnephaeus nilssonii]|uniref:Sushi domain-containing protein n=1 Tax=Cnephaeus nilssonii TaxID=3371016 RepID=A0AA40HDP3_CNENI|nr:hypothetical protein QTO34_011531 [Eptesicus nilssonii]